jgi:hypothetical protein
MYYFCFCEKSQRLTAAVSHTIAAELRLQAIKAFDSNWFVSYTIAAELSVQAVEAFDANCTMNSVNLMSSCSHIISHRHKRMLHRI